MKTDFPNSSQAPRIYHEKYERNTNVHMFKEDIALSIMPIGGKSKNFLDFSAKFIGDDSDNKNAIKVCKSLVSDDYSRGETKLICKCIERIARFLSSSGILIYEILYDIENEQIRLLPVTRDKIYRVPFGFVQIPPKDGQNYGKTFNFLNARNLWTMEMPLILGGKQGYKNIISNLKKFDSLGPRFYLKNLEEEAMSNSFNYKLYRQTNNVYTTQATLNWKWDQRDMDRDDKTEFYMFYQDLSFLWAQAILRESIIQELNTLFDRLEIKSRIVISGIPTPKEILSFQEAFVKGEKDFGDVLKYIFY